MDIGKEDEKITIEPIKSPIPARPDRGTPEPVKEPEQEPTKEPVKV
jgi:hypothetical protein